MGVELEVTDTGAGHVKATLENLAQSIVFGVFEDATPYPDGTSVRDVAAAQEFGTDDIQQRSWLRGWVDSGGQSVIANVGEDAIGKTIDGADVAAASEAIGKAAVEGVVKRIEAGSALASLAASTLANPNRDSRGIPLLDTEHLRDSIAWSPGT